MIRIEESYNFLLDTLSRFDEGKLVLSDEELSYQIFEELDSEYHSFLHEWTVDRLIDGGFIPKSLRQRLLDLRENIWSIMEEKHTIEEYRNDPDWEGLRNAANSIFNELKV